jgi:TIR domain-containing protein/SIR2-like protein
MSDVELLPAGGGVVPGPPPGGSEKFWRRLLSYVEGRQSEKRVIPIVGQDLLVLEIGGRRVSLDTYLAERLATELGQEPPAPSPGEPAMAEPLTLNRVIYRYIKQERPLNLDLIYDSLSGFLDESGSDAVPVPEPLLKLAELPFRIFVTTTFDPLLARALRQVRKNENVEVRGYSVRDRGGIEDLPEDFDPDRETLVYHLLGRLTHEAQDFAVTEEDLVEFFRCLHKRPPEALFGELDQGHLLIIGSSFSEWLARFFIRLPTRDERLWDVQMKRADFLADPRLLTDVTLVPFLESFCGHATLFREGDAVTFVNELHRRWVERGRRSPRPARETRPEGKIFLSYAHEDAKAVEKIRSRLEGEELAVWIDHQQLRGGEVFHDEIKRAIERAFVFVAVLSQSTRDWEARFYRREWTFALEHAGDLPPNRKFILPVAIDSIDYGDETIPGGLRGLDWIRLPGGEPDDAFVQRVREVFRAADKAQKRPQRD